MEIRYGVVGEIMEEEMYIGLYIFIQQYHNNESVLVHVSNYPRKPQDTMLNFLFNGTWIPNQTLVESQLKSWGVTKIFWHEKLESDLPPYAD
jgi:hypothetical protein